MESNEEKELASHELSLMLDTSETHLTLCKTPDQDTEHTVPPQHASMASRVRDKVSQAKPSQGHVTTPEVTPYLYF